MCFFECMQLDQVAYIYIYIHTLENHGFWCQKCITHAYTYTRKEQRKQWFWMMLESIGDKRHRFRNQIVFFIWVYACFVHLWHQNHWLFKEYKHVLCTLDIKKTWCFLSICRFGDLRRTKLATRSMILIPRVYKTHKQYMILESLYMGLGGTGWKIIAIITLPVCEVCPNPSHSQATKQMYLLNH